MFDNIKKRSQVKKDLPFEQELFRTVLHCCHKQVVLPKTSNCLFVYSESSVVMHDRISLWTVFLSMSLQIKRG